MTHVSIVLVHYNTPEYTTACLKSLSELKTRDFTYKVVVVDNGSLEAFSLKKQYQSFATVVRSVTNLGFTGGNNLGISHAIETYDSEFVFLLNTDTELAQDSLKQLITALQNNPKMGAVCPKIYFGKGHEFHTKEYSKEQLGNVLWYAGGSIDWRHLVGFHRGVDEVDRGQFDNQQNSDFATGCAMLVRREVLEKIGGFDERYFLYFEDVDLSLKIRAAGYEIGFEPQAQVWHFNAGSTGGSGSAVHEYYQTRNRLLLAFAHGTWKEWLAALRIAWQTLRESNSVKTSAVWHALSGTYGKQPII